MSFWRYIPHKIPTAQSNDDERACWDQWVLGTSEWFTAASDEALDTWVICAERPWWAACWRCNSASSVRCCGTAGWTDLEHIVLHDSLLSSYAWSQSHSWHTRQKNRNSSSTVTTNCSHSEQCGVYYVNKPTGCWSVKLCLFVDIRASFTFSVYSLTLLTYSQNLLEVLRHIALLLDTTDIIDAVSMDGCTRSRSVLCYRCHHHSCV